jgi:hypothetical protein
MVPPRKNKVKRGLNYKKSAVYRNHDIGNPLLDGYSLAIAYENFSFLKKRSHTYKNQEYHDTIFCCRSGCPEKPG